MSRVTYNYGVDDGDVYKLSCFLRDSVICR